MEMDPFTMELRETSPELWDPGTSLSRWLDSWIVEVSLDLLGSLYHASKIFDRLRPCTLNKSDSEARRASCISFRPAAPPLFHDQAMRNQLATSKFGLVFESSALFSCANWWM